METANYRAYAKLNLSLDVTGKREDGYHLMDMVNVSVSLFDTLTIRETPGKPFSIASTARVLPTGEKNLIWKGASALFRAAGRDLPNVHIHTVKRIPTQAGLGGGSADAAAAMVALNECCGLGVSLEEICRLSASVGADVPFCVYGGYARVTGIGECLEPFTSPARYQMVLVMPQQGKSTKAVFEAIDSDPLLHHPDTGQVVSLLKSGDAVSAMKWAENVFETSIPDEETRKIVGMLRQEGAFHAALTGTGACVFGMFRNYKKAIHCRNRMREEGYGAWTAFPTRSGVKRV